MASDSGDRETACTLEFAVQMTCQSCVDAVRRSLQGVPGKSQCIFCEPSRGLRERQANLLDPTSLRQGKAPSLSFGFGQAAWQALWPQISCVTF
uniref:Copper chaperone for superoxide dismutase n=1 Tax=Myotis myotis TaxID=51298 RepID=A0A7J7VG99_MYOMY|nr:copper chaperone for superoxide dismutase [Myotis myotis]